MEYTATAVDGCWIVDIQAHTDERGFFSRTFDRTEFEERGMDSFVAQANMSFNHRAGTMRGMHRQVEPYAEGKLVRCTRGRIVDCCLDLREQSPTFGKHVMVELTDENHRALWIPPYCAHGYLTLTDNTEVTYQVSGPYAPQGERGHRYNDPAFGLKWPREVDVISEKDSNWADWDGKPIR